MLRNLMRPRRLAAAFLTASSVCLFTPLSQAQEPAADAAPVETAPAEIAPSNATPAPKPAVGAPVSPAPCDPNGLQEGLDGPGGVGGIFGHHNRVSPPTQWGYGKPDLFYNYYVPPVNGGVAAAMYTSPGPVPPLVGQTYITYQPFMPHEQMYHHHRIYHRYYDEGRGISRAHISWYCPPVRHYADQFYFNKIRLAR